MNFGRVILFLLSAMLFVACEPKPIEVTPSATNLAIPVTPNSPPAFPTQAQPKLPTTKLLVGGQEIDAEMALTFDQERTGMMFRTNLTDNDAMIFVFPFPQQASFWMKNCPESLSAAYINPDGVIEEIHHLEKQDTNSVLSASSNIGFVLEVKDGWFQRHGINPGAMITTPTGPLKETFVRRQ